MRRKVRAREARLESLQIALDIGQFRTILFIAFRTIQKLNQLQSRRFRPIVKCLTNAQELIKNAPIVKCLTGAKINR